MVYAASPWNKGIFPSALLLSALLLSGPAPAGAAHYITGQEPNGFCYDCHTLNPNEGETGTSFINSNSRTLPWMKIFNGGSAPVEFGCTYCHNNTNNGQMREALSHFGLKTSKHPVGLNFVTAAESTGEYFSSWSSATADELDCVDCHDVSLGSGPGYPEHGAPPVGNPLMLRNVSAAGEYDDLCRLCHGAAAAPVKGSDVRVTSHADGDTGNPMLEADGTVIKAADRDGDGVHDIALTDLCTGCHDTHFSNSQRLFNDGHEGDTAIVGSDCTAVCHHPGDSDGSYLNHGHGIAQSTYKYSGGAIDQAGGNNVTMAMACTTCHVSLDPAAKPHSENPSAGTPQEIYKTRFNLNISLQSWDSGTLFGNPLYGVCYQCHATYDTHQGAGAGTDVGCLDCHDEHAEGSGTGSNVFMIPETSKGEGSYAAAGRAKAGAEGVLYNSPRLLPSGAPDAGNEDFFAAADAGVCDNSECHGAAGYTPLATYMAGAAHSGGTQTAGSDCGGCHRHNGDPAGGWRYVGPGCDTCHNDPLNPTGIARTHIDANESPGGHLLHATSTVVGDCDDCHAHNGKTVSPMTGIHGDGTVNFGGPLLGAALDYSGSAFTSITCTAANGCHDDDAGDWAAGTLGADSCLDCHLSTGKVLSVAPASGLHTAGTALAHDDSFDAGYGCTNCHDAGGPSATHVDGDTEAAAETLYSFNGTFIASYESSGYPLSTGCAATCHADGGSWLRRWVGADPDAPTGADNPGDPVCDNCHGDGLANATTVDGLWAGPTPDHEGDWDGDGTAGEVLSPLSNHLSCEACHGWGTGAYDENWEGTSPAHGDGSISMNGPDTAHGGPAGTEYDEDAWTCLSACHGGTHNAGHAMESSPWPVNYGDFGTFGCDFCHGPAGPGPTVVWPAANAPGKNTSYGSHLGATTAEEGNAFLGAVSDWKVQCNKCHDAHYGAIEVPAPPSSWSDPSGRLSGSDMQARLGLTYATAPGVGIHLGGTAQGGASEAQFCWGCHDSNSVSEWGFNTKTTPLNFPHVDFATSDDGTQESQNYGWIYTTTGHTTKTSNWTQGYWQSQYDPLITKRIASIHSASFNPAGQSSSVASNVNGSGQVDRSSPAYEALGYVRCSYCHAVHDTFGPDGKPYVRGNWVGNPYPPELPPRTGNPYTSTVPQGGVGTPRSRSTGAGAYLKGGYFIDQNSNRPTNNAAMDTTAETAGLCILCHDSSVNDMDFYTGSTLWRAPMVNGHSNSTLGGTRSNARDLFNALRSGGYLHMGVQAYAPGESLIGGCNPTCDPNLPQSSTLGAYQDSPIRDVTSWYGTDYAGWYTAGQIGGGDGPGTLAHKFTCSKCHSPHATGLPALLIHSCIDPAQGNWSNGTVNSFGFQSNNCHRKTSTGDGWHVLAPGE